MTGATTVKVALIMGFYGNVENQLRTSYGAAFDRGSLLWIPMQARNRPNVEIFKQALKVVLQDRTSDPVHVLLGTARGEEWIHHAVTRIVESMEGAREHKRVSLWTFANLQDADALIRKLEECAFCVDDAPVITEAMLAEYLGDSKVLCVRPVWQASYRDALERAGISAALIDRYFVEDAVPAGRNSNLVQQLDCLSAQFGFLLYAFHGLRHLPPNTKQKYKGGAFPEATTAAVVAIFKASVLRRWKSARGRSSAAGFIG